MNHDPIVNRAITTIRLLSVDGVQAADSGHPGMPMGAAPMAYVIWKKHLRHNPDNPHWYGRDRFVLSPGHGSMLLYSLLHLTGYDLPLEELEKLPPVGQQDAWTPRVRPHARRRDDDRSAGAGHGQRRRHGDGRSAPRRAD